MNNITISNSPYLNIGDIYDKLKTKQENAIRYDTYFSLLWNTLLDMFTWENLPDTIPKRFLESILHSTGQVFVSRIKNDVTGEESLIASGGTLSGEVDAYGLGTECIAVCPTGEAHGLRNIDIAYGINNDSASPDNIIYWISHLLGETDKSIKTNLIYARFLKIPKLRTDKDKQAFHEIFEKLTKGEPEAFVSSNVLDLELGDGTETFELTDVNKIDKLPYLTQFFEDALKHFYNFYGQPMQNQNKRAQSISDEIHGMDSVSFIIPMQMLNCRKALAENINRIFGTDIGVDFSPLWKLEYQALIVRDTNGNGTPDSTETESAETETESAETETESAETETESAETETESAETETETDEKPTDSPAMAVENENPIESTPETSESETGAKSEELEGNEDDPLGILADIFDTTIDELRDMIAEKKGAV